MIPRKKDARGVLERLKTFPVVGLLGPRQCGKTTLARSLNFDHYFDLENPRHLRSLENPQLALEDLDGTIVIDEIQRRPDIFPLLRVLVDGNRRQKYLILGSASRDLIKQSSESLAGRISYFDLGGLRLDDVGEERLKKLWLRGGLPRSFTTRSDETSLLWRESYISTFLRARHPPTRVPDPLPGPKAVLDYALPLSRPDR